MSARRQNTFEIRGEIVVVDISTPKHPMTFTVVSRCDLPIITNAPRRWYAVYTGSGTTGLYVMRSNEIKYEKLIRLHRSILQTDKQVDHKDGDGLNNLRSNLRSATTAQNAWNQKTTKHTSQFRGVSWNTKVGKWVAQIIHNYKNHFLGYYDTEEEAATVYNGAALKLFGEFSRPTEIVP